MIDFEKASQAALNHFPEILAELLPHGITKGREYLCGDLAGNPGQSLSVNLDNGKWADFATGDKGGDPVSLVAAIHGVSQAEAAHVLNEQLGIKAQQPSYNKNPPPKNKPTNPVKTWNTLTATTKPQSIIHPKHGSPSFIWEYKSPLGELLGYACRFDPVEGKKEVLPFTYGTDTNTGETGWKWKIWPEPRPMYGLDRLKQRPESPVLWVEGEKTADAAQRLLPSVVVVTSPGGCKAVNKADFTPLKDRRVAIWPDNDKSGREAAEAVASASLESGALEVYIIDPPPDKSEGWDVADAEAEGWKQTDTSEWIQGNRRKIHKIMPKIKAVREWPELSPLSGHQQVDPYPIDALPGTIGAAVREVVDFVQCPIALGACSALAVVSIAAQGLVDVRRADKLEGPTSLYLLAIADSGERKTSVDGFFSKPVQEWEAEQAEAAKPELKRHEVEIETWKAKKSGLLVAIKDNSKAGKATAELEAKMMELEIIKPQPPKVPRLLFGDTTPEALAYRLGEGWPVGGVLSSEAGNVFGGHAMGKDSAMRNMAMLNSLWGAEPLTIDRRSVPSFTLRSARLTMGLAVQSGTVRAFLDSSKGLARGIGWLARFLIAWPESTQGERPFKDSPKQWPHLAKFHRRIGALLDLPLNFNDRGELEPLTIDLSPEAKEVWVAFHNDIEAELRPGRDMAETKDVASKAADHAARLAALFHLFEGTPSVTIGPDHMKAAASLAGWHLYEARRFMSEIALPAELNNVLNVENWLVGFCRQNRVAEVSTRDIQRLGPNCTRKKSDLDAALQELTEAGRIRVGKDGQRKLVTVSPLLIGI